MVNKKTRNSIIRFCRFSYQPLTFSLSAMAAQYDDSQAEAEEEDENTFSFISHLSGTLCVLDCSEDMTSKDPQTGISSIVLSLEAIKSTYCNKLISGSRDYLGVVLCGVDSKTNDYPGLHVLLPLDIPDKSCVEVLEKTVSDFMKGTFQFGYSHSYSSYHLLWTCNSIFTSCIKKLGNRTAMIFTNVSQPLNMDKKTRQLAITKARDMSELGISISVITLPTADGSQFDMEKFYSAIVPDQELISPTNDIEDLTMRVHRRESKISLTQNINFVVSEDMTVGVRLARLYGDTPSKNLNLCSKTNEPVVRVSTTVREADRTVLLPHEVYRSVKCGTETVLFSQEETDQMKIRTAKGLYLIGFQPASKVKMHHVAGTSLFVRPCDHVYTGSSDFLSALLERLSARGLVAMCHCVPIEGNTGFVGALVPQKEVRSVVKGIIRLSFQCYIAPFLLWLACFHESLMDIIVQYE